MRFLLVSPDFNRDQTKARSTLLANVKSLPFFQTKAYMAPLGLATLAAMTPESIEVDIWDEAICGQLDDGTGLAKQYDFVGVTGYSTQFSRVREIGRIVRGRGIPVAIGGPGVSGTPELYQDEFDIIFIGEAEQTWKEFISDWLAGHPRRQYRQVQKVDMSLSPPPRWDSIQHDMEYYLAAGVQTTRGCPFDCEFCDVISIYGRQARHKPIDQVLEEVCALERLGIEQIFFCDDNFIGNPRFAKALLRELVPMNRSFRRPIGFITQLTLNVANDEELLELLADANFNGLVIGLETPNYESLRETNKPQNYNTDIVEAVKRVQSYGLPINPGMVVGFDHDDSSIFERQFDFLQQCGLGTPVLNTLKAPSGTRLWHRLNNEGRLVDISPLLDAEDPADYALTNIVPRSLTRLELLSGYRRLVEKVRDWNNFELRVKEMISQQRRKPETGSDDTIEFARLFALFGLLSSMDEEVRGCCVRMLDYTRQRAPYMMNRVIRQIVQQYLASASVPALLQSVDDQIALEQCNQTPGMPAIPDFAALDAFRETSGRIFPELYKNACDRLIDKSRTDLVLIEVLTEYFLDTPSAVQSLYAICDRIVDRENCDAVPCDGVVEREAREWTLLAADILDGVEQEIRMRHRRRGN